MQLFVSYTDTNKCNSVITVTCLVYNLDLINATLDLITGIGTVVAVPNTYRDDISDGYSILDEKPTIGYSIPDEIPTTCFQLCELV